MGPQLMAVLKKLGLTGLGAGSMGSKVAGEGMGKGLSKLGSLAQQNPRSAGLAGAGLAGAGMMGMGGDDEEDSYEELLEKLRELEGQ